MTLTAFLLDQGPNLGVVSLTGLDAEAGHPVDQLAFRDVVAHQQSS